jgi:2-hydroxy-3-keto-5-methylthiopentenyl-1-phosphate phosphatase
MMNSKEKFKRIVFCDFDGTITAEETFVGMLKQFATENYTQVKQQIIDKDITLGEGVRRMVESVPSEIFPQVLDYIGDKEIRAGFPELLDYLYFHGVPFVVISGGLLESVKTRLESFAARILAIHAAEVNTDGDYLKLFSKYQNQTELVAKTEVMSTYNFEQAVVIGDGITDLNMAMAADIVFARDYLSKFLTQNNKSFIRWDDFFDVLNHLSKRWLAT